MGFLADALRDSGSAGTLGDFEEEPVPLTTFVQDRKYLANPPLSDIQYEAVRYAERVYLPATYGVLAASADRDIRTYWSDPLRMVNFITLEWGKGGGKDHICRMISLRVAYLLLCLTSPQDYFGMPEQDTIHCLNVASSSAQASRAFFSPMRRAVGRKGCWFQDVAEAVELTGRARRGAAKSLMNLIRFDKNVEAISGHSDAESQEGLNLILGIADEIDAFRSQAELEKVRGARAREAPNSAEAILNMLRTSAATRFPEVYKNVRISYPRFLGSTIQKLRAEGERDNAEQGASSRHYVSGPHPTWVVNPRVPGKEAFAGDYREDPVLARAKYECRPERAINPYFSNVQALDSCFVDYPAPPLRVEYVREGAAWRPEYTFGAGLYPVKGAVYGMHADLAVKGDRAGVALAHVASWQEVEVIGTNEKGREITFSEARPVVKVDFAIAYESDAGVSPPREIQIRWARLLCLELRRRGFQIRRFTFDQFQSQDSMQILETHGIETDRVSTDLTEDPWRTLRDLSSEARIAMPRDPLVRDELLGLSRLPNGKIDHLADGSKDVADALSCSVLAALELGGREDLDGSRAYIADLALPPTVQSEDLPAGMPRGAALGFEGDVDYAAMLNSASDLPSSFDVAGLHFADTGTEHDRMT